jgi:SAM-dependent methyltransferase
MGFEAQCDRGASPCPVCGQASEAPFVEVDGLPAHVGVLWRSAAGAAAAPRGPMRMHCCAGCGYVWNAAFDPGLLDYEQEYDNALHGSSLFREFEAATVAHLVERYGLKGREVVEVGCGDGRFLGLLCTAGDNRGVGFEPGARAERRAPEADERVDVLAEAYTADHPRRGGDLLAARQVLEHMADPVGFLATLRRGIGERGTALYVDVPNGARLTDDLAFWDLMYEHCGSYVEPALRAAAEAAGFAVMEVRPAHSGQFLVLEATPAPVAGTAGAAGGPAPRRPDEAAPYVERVARFGAAFGRRVAEWRDRLAEHARRGRTVVAWGAGGRAVNFFNTVGIGPEVAAVVDLNPAKQHTFLAGTGHEVVPPARLVDLDPDVVIVVNGVYADEVRRDLERAGLAPAVEVA